MIIAGPEVLKRDTEKEQKEEGGRTMQVYKEDVVEGARRSRRRKRSPQRQIKVASRRETWEALDKG